VPGLDLTPTARKLFHLEDFEPPGADIVPQQPSDKRHPFDEKVGLDKDEFNKFQDEVRVKKVLGYLGGEGVQSASCCRVLVDLSAAYKPADYVYVRTDTDKRC
jgi:hypothetical protein